MKINEIDNNVTPSIDSDKELHKYRMENDDNYRVGYMLNKKYEEMARKQALQDQSMLMTLIAEGPTSLAAYGTPITHSVNRFVNAINRRDPKALVGLPTKKILIDAIKQPGKSREKIKWQAISNLNKAMQIDGIMNQ